MDASRSRRSAEPVSVVGRVLDTHVSPTDRIVVGLSGGLDSVVLLHLLLRIRTASGFALGAVHVNHQLSPNAARWSRFCDDLCAAWGVEFTQRCVSVDRGGGQGPEAAARAARYRVFETIDADWLALAHHRDDQAETVLLNLLRGSGMHGMAAMPVVRPLKSGRARLLRPLLDLSRTQIHDYARQQGLLWVEDESNADLALRRNFVRHRVLPLTEEGFPGCRDSLARAGRWAGEAALLLDDLATADGAGCLGADGRLDLVAFNELSPERGRNLLRYWLRDGGLRMPDGDRLEAMRAALALPRAQHGIRIDVEGAAVRSYRGRASIEPKLLTAPRDALPWRGEAHLAWGAGSVCFNASHGDGVSRRALAAGQVTLRPRRGGERLQLAQDRPHRTLKNLFQETGIPPWLRAAIPLLWCGDDLVWVPEVGSCWRYRCAKDEPGLIPVWRRTSG